MSRQSLCKLHLAAADIWPRCRIGLIADPDTGAEGAPADLLAGLISVGAIEPLACAEGIVPVAVTDILGLGNRTVLIAFSDMALRDAIMPAFARMRLNAAGSDEQIAIFRDGQRIGVARRDGPISWGEADEATPLLKLALTEIALEGIAGLAIHAAALLRDDRAMLLLGAPGAGKSTLSMRLDNAGFALAADDLVELGSDGRARTLPFPATLKHGAWPLLAARRPDLAQLPTFRRPDEKIVRYLPVERALSDRPRHIGWIVVLDRHDGAAPAATPLGAAEIFATLLGSAWSGSSELDPDGFDGLAAGIDGARCIRLTYSDLDAAAAWLDSFCAGNDPSGCGHRRGDG